MNEIPEKEKKAGRPAVFRSLSWRALVLTALVALAVVLWVFHPTFLELGVRHTLEAAAPASGLNVAFEGGGFRLGQPFELRNIRIRPSGSLPTQTDLTIESLKLSFNQPEAWFFGPRRLVRSIVVKGVDGLLDLRIASLPPWKPLPETSTSEKRTIADRILFALPQAVSAEAPALSILADDQSYVIAGFSATFDEAAAGVARAASISAKVGAIQKTFGPQTGTTAWKDGVLYLSDVPVADGLRIERFTTDFVEPDGIVLTFDLQAFGGSIRGDIAFPIIGGYPSIDGALAAYALSIPALEEFIEIRGGAKGVLREAKLTYRGYPDRPLSAEASLRFRAEAVRWGERGWDDFEVGANLIGDRLTVSEFVLRQGGNAVRLVGEATLPRQAENWPDAPFSFTAAADLSDLGKLAELFGSRYSGLRGSVRLQAEASGSRSRPRGFLRLEAAKLGYDSVEIDQASLELKLAKNEIRVAHLKASSGADSLEGKGSVGLSAPHRYSGALQLKVANFGDYLRPFAIGETLRSGGIEAAWEGDGSIKSHSGAGTVRLRDLKSEWTPEGLSGEMRATYAPDSAYISELTLTRGRLALRCEASFSREGASIRNMTLHAGKVELLRTQAFVPLNVYEMPAKGLRALALDKPIYLNMESKELGLGELQKLAGQTPSAAGSVSAVCVLGGSLRAPLVEGLIKGQNLKPADDQSIPTADLEIRLATADAQLRASGELKLSGFDPATIEAAMPITMKIDDHGAAFLDTQAPISATLNFPRTSVNAFRPYLPKIRRMDGTVAGQLSLSGTFEEPNLQGHVELNVPRLEFTTSVPEILDWKARVDFDGAYATLSEFRGEVAAGPFEATGRLELADPHAFNLKLTGKKVLLVRNDNLRLRANVDLQAVGNHESGEVNGSVLLTDGRFLKRLEILPLLVGAGASQPSESGSGLPGLDKAVAAPFGGYRLNVRLANADPFTVAGNVASGEIVPDLVIKGTLADYVPVGKVQLKDFRAYLPFSIMEIPEGRIFFTEKEPRVPILDIRGRTRVQNYDITATALGPFEQRRVMLRSEPPLPQEDIVVLLSTGLTPGARAGAGFGAAAAGQGGLLLFRALIRQFNLGGTEFEELLNRVQVGVAPGRDPSQRPTLQGTVRFTDALGLLTERDGYGFYNAAATYTIRLK